MYRTMCVISRIICRTWPVLFSALLTHGKRARIRLVLRDLYIEYDIIMVVNLIE